MIFDPGVPPASSYVDGSQAHLLVTQNLSDAEHHSC